jgi:2-dehydro-3-deoxyphosphogluconate aldolase / (4S)-4-hydroxy-2-oxoglutarate aldolase
MDLILNKLNDIGVMPILEIEDSSLIEDVGRVLLAGGLPLAEITFRTSEAEVSIQKLTKTYPQIIVGAGTVINVNQAEKAVDSGAKFLVSPGFSERIIEWAINRSILIIPGVATPSEILKAMDYGLSVLKYFPIEQLGGVKMITSLAGPFKTIKFVPTGGISMSNLADYIRLPNVFACGGSWIAHKSLLKAGRFDEITQRARDAINVIRKAREN